MPWAGILEGRRVIPTQVPDGATVICPECQNLMGPRRGYDKKDGTSVARHFRHHPGPNCPGESDTHLRMKAILAWKLPRILPFVARVFEDEKKIGSKLPDVLVEFQTPRFPWGFGIAVECQYRNDSKDYEATEQEYLRHGYTTMWLTEDDFTEFDVDVPRDPSDPRIVPVWPRAVPRERDWPGRPAYSPAARGKMEIDFEHLLTTASGLDEIWYWMYPQLLSSWEAGKAEARSHQTKDFPLIVDFGTLLREGLTERVQNHLAYALGLSEESSAVQLICPECQEEVWAIEKQDKIEFEPHPPCPLLAFDRGRPVSRYSP